MTEIFYIKVSNGNLEIRNITDSEFCYFISKSELPLIRDSHLSECIMQLIDKLWISVGTLYRIAKTIQQEFPNNNIDWHETFFVVEKSKYIDSFVDVLLVKKKSLVDTFFQEIVFARKETTPDTNDIINRIVAKRLKEFEL